MALKIKDPEAVERALAPRAPRLGWPEALFLVVLVGPLLAAVASARWSFVAGAGAWLWLATSLGLGTLGAASALRLVCPSPPAGDHEDPLFEGPPETRLDHLLGILASLALTNLLLVLGLGALQIWAGMARLPVPPTGLLVAVVLGNLGGLARGTPRGARAALALRAAPAPRGVRALVWAWSVLALGILMTRTGWTHLLAVLVELGGMALFLGGSFCLVALPHFLTEPGLPGHDEMVRMLRKPRATLLEAIASELYRVTIFMALAAGIPIALLFFVVAADPLTGVVSLLLGVSLLRGASPGIRALLPEGVLGARVEPSTREALLTPVRAGRAQCRYCGETILVAAAVVCGACESHHHRDCWEEYGGCVVYACGGREPRALLEAAPESA